MKVDIKIAEGITEPYAVIYTGTLTDEIQRAVSNLTAQDNTIPVVSEERIFMLKPEEIYMVRVENNQLTVYCLDKNYVCRKRLYEISELLGGGFMQISKSTIINLTQVDYIEPYFNGMMNLRLKNGLSEYISRKYLLQFKKYFGI